MIGLQAALRFNGGGHINHSIFWQVSYFYVPRYFLIFINIFLSQQFFVEERFAPSLYFVNFFVVSVDQHSGFFPVNMLLYPIIINFLSWVFQSFSLFYAFVRLLTWNTVSFRRTFQFISEDSLQRSGSDMLTPGAASQCCGTGTGTGTVGTVTF